MGASVPRVACVEWGEGVMARFSRTGEGTRMPFVESKTVRMSSVLLTTVRALE